MRGVVLLALIGALGSAAACPLPLSTRIVEVAGQPLEVEIADTAAARACGLSHRDKLDEGSGMLFVFPSPRPLEFWMKDTRMPLSIAFLDAHGVVLSIQDMTPIQTSERYRSPQPAMFALETRRGWFAQLRVRIGDKVELGR